MLVTKLGFYKVFPTHLFLIFTSRLLAGPRYEIRGVQLGFDSVFLVFSLVFFSIFLWQNERAPLASFRYFFISYFLFP